MPATERGPVEIYLLPGESTLVTRPTVLHTVLGSCVGIALVALQKQVAGFCHPMLPLHPELGSGTASAAFSRRYVDSAIRELLDAMDSRGVGRAEITAKLFGGADVLQPIQDGSRPTVGKLNCEVALRVLREEGVMVSATRLGGTSGLTIEFHSETGEVLVRKLQAMETETRRVI